MNRLKKDEPVYYNGRFCHGVDDKRRMQVPAKWRPRKAGIELTLILWPVKSVGSCVRVLTPLQFARLVLALEELPNSDPHKVTLRRIIGGGSAQASLDRTGRICLPEDVARGAGLNDQAQLVGCINYFEIWNPELFDKVQAVDAVLAPDAFQLMG